MPKITIDPVTRIEGHLRIEAQVDGGAVTDAWSSGTMFRGMEIILRGRDPREAWIWAQRICGVCTTVHALASVRAVENALGIEIPPNARIIRNLMAAAQHVQDHVIHFYHLHALDWVDVSLAAKADPAATSLLAQSVSEWPKSSTTYFRGIQQRVQALIDSGQLSLFASGYWGHPAYRLSPEASLLAVAHYLEALEWQRDVIRIHAVLGGKNPHPQTYLVGGMATPIDPNSPQALNPERVEFLRQRILTARTFVEQVLIPDVVLVAKEYLDWSKLGASVPNYLAYGGLPQGSINDPSTFAFPRGVILNNDLSQVHPFDQTKVTEQVAHSWYAYSSGNDQALQPFDGETEPKYTGPQPPYEFLETDQKYSWLKSPRYDGQPVQVGPLARMLIAYASGVPRVKQLVDNTLSALGARPPALFSTLGRIAARAIESQYLAELMEGWLNELRDNMEHGDLRNSNTALWDRSKWPRQARGYGLHEAPRGALGHWLTIEDGTIKNYQAVVPSTWNAGPRDSKGQRGPYEEALIGTPIADPERPLEILRTIHSFDPCLACAVHVVDAQGRERIRVNVEHDH
jgi:hydrogenase large subunit